MSTSSILCIESSGTTCGVALVLNGALAAEYSLFVPNIHDKLLAQLTRRLLDDCSLRVEDLSAVAVSAGPGSFTGLRIGASFAKALCYDNQPKLIAVPTLHAFASAADEFAQSINAEKILAVVSSQRGVYFLQEFDTHATPLSQPTTYTKEEVQAFCTPRTVVCGTAATEFGGIQLSGLNRLTPRFIARLAVRMMEAGAYTDAQSFAPNYHQDFVPKQSSQTSPTV